MFLIQIFFTPLLVIGVCRFLLTEQFLQKKDYVLVLMIALLSGGIYSVNPALEPVITLVLLFSIILYFRWLSFPILKVITVAITTMLLLIIGDTISGVILITLLKLDALPTELVRHDPKIYLMFSTILFAVVMLATIGINRITSLWKKYSEVLDHKGFVISLVMTMSLVFISFYYLVFSYQDKSQGGIFALTVAMLSLLVSVAVVSVVFMQFKFKDLRLEAKKTEMDQLTRYTSELEILYDDMRKFKHDYINMIASMAGYLETDNLLGLKDFFNQKIMPLGKKFEQDDIKLGQLGYLEQIELKGIISSKCLYAQELGVNVYLDIVEPIRINMDMIDLCRVIGIWLDNAIEAAQTSENPRLKLGIIKKESTTFIVISNTVNQMPPLYKLREKGFSTKDKNRGIGLESVKKVLDRYDYITNDMVFEGDEFKQVIEIYQRTDIS